MGRLNNLGDSGHRESGQLLKELEKVNRGIEYNAVASNATSRSGLIPSSA